MNSPLVICNSLPLVRGSSEGRERIDKYVSDLRRS